MYIRQIASATLLSVALAGSSALSEPQMKRDKILETSTTWSGQKIEYPQTGKPVITSLVVEFQPGADTGWHMHPVPEYLYVLDGTLLVEDENGNKKELHPGQAAVEVNNYHHGMNPGNTPTKFLVVFVGGEGLPLTVDRKTQ